MATSEREVSLIAADETREELNALVLDDFEPAGVRLHRRSCGPAVKAAAAAAAVLGVVACLGTVVWRSAGGMAAGASAGGEGLQVLADATSHDSKDIDGRKIKKAGCYTIKTREECCEFYDGRDWDYHGSPCVPAKPHASFPNGRICQPRCWVEGGCDWNHSLGSKTFVEHAGSCEATTTTTTPPPTTTATSTTATSTTATTTTQTPECWTENVTFEPLDRNASTLPRVAKTPLECQRLCRKEKSCRHFSFWVPAGHCYFENMFALPQPFRLGFTSGPRDCSQALDLTKWVNLGNDTWVRKQFDCLKVGLTFTSNVLGQPEIDPTLSGLQAALACQKACANRSDCANFTMYFPAKTCELVSAGALLSPTANEAIVGAREC